MNDQAAHGWLGRDTREGLRAGLTIVPSFLAIFASFGVIAQVVGMPAEAALALTLAVYAAPAQFAMLEVAAQAPGALAQMIAVGVLVNLRFVVMSMSLAQLFPPLRRSRLALAAQLVSASSYLLTFFRARRAPGTDVLRYFAGIALVAYPAAVAGTLLGLAFGADLPPLVAFGATLFLPIYFAVLLASEVRAGAEIGAVAGGLVLTPPLELLLPGWGMFVTALGVGAALCLVQR